MTANTFKILAPAKINWFLNVENQSRTGYHQLQTFMQSVNLFDVIQCTPLDDDCIEFEDLNNSCGCSNDKNIIVRSAKKIKKSFNIDSGIKISIEKNIPVCAGLGGGSSDAAAIINFLLKFWKIKISNDKKNELAASLGADVPFFLHNKAALCGGIGEKITSFSARSFHLVLWNPNAPLSTAEVFKQFDKKLREQRSPQLFLENYSSGNLHAIAQKIWNNLAFAAEELLPELKNMKNECVSNGAITSWISGSGPTVVSLCNDFSEAEKLAAKLKKNHPEHFICECKTMT